MKSWTVRIILIVVVAIIATLIFLRSCTQIDIPLPFFGRISEGVIEYKTVPVNPNDPMGHLLSDQMVVKFKDNYSAAQLKALGMTSSFISDPKTNKFYSVVSLVGTKYASVMDQEEIGKVNHYFGEYSVEETGETKKIAGYKCQKAIIRFKDEKRRPATVWYTKEIKIEHPNWANAYYKVDGVLMDYELEKFGMALHFTATAVRKEPVPSDEFSIPKDYKRIPNSQLEEIFAAFH